MAQTPGFFSEDEKSEILHQSYESELIGTLTGDLLELARQKKLFHLAAPQELGGRELSVLELMEIFEEASCLDGSFGWLITLGAGAGMFGAYMDPKFAGEIFSDRDLFITGSGYPAGTASPGNDTFTVEGRWKYASGTPHATLFTATCVIPNPKSDEPELRVMSLYPHEVTNLDTWNSYGLKATASHDFEVKNVEIPRHRSFPIAPRPVYANRPLYRFPFMPFASATLAASMLGITRGFLEQCESETPGCEEATDTLLNHRQNLYRSVETVWRKCETGAPIAQTEVDEIEQTAKNLAAMCRITCFDIYGRLGMKVLDESTRLNRSWRDLMTARQHNLLRDT